MDRITILIADDDPEIAELIALHLEKEGYRPIKAADGQEAVAVVKSRHIDLAILDIMMPGLDGYEVTRQIRGQYLFPVIFLSAKTSDLDKITGLVIGADDYMTKPFNPMELVARVNAQLRRSMLLSPTSAANVRQVEAGGLMVDPDRHSVTLYGNPVKLTPKEFDILYLLAANPRQVFSADHIFQQVWGDAYYEGGNTVMVHIRTLRKKLGEEPDRWIKTIWGVGYIFNG
ncbi:DNA-binding response OmpR family regulator [Paenibacillus forsythiae]|uniref:DNA-binding response OmpR family regulator n=1 Tax=Paenibacillus forsythiae TaxID=365616 RepID=A0ABU3H8R9_9BACL|nr:response regulator transcription factor [Paenibacillus forsythiae]MDT3427228.1 DNA-binding response OmpR family regulator [Paenibacillus forsythiae]